MRWLAGSSPYFSLEGLTFAVIWEDDLFIVSCEGCRHSFAFRNDVDEEEILATLLQHIQEHLRIGNVA
jgi:hypothetical protein